MDNMKAFDISLKSINDVKDFVDLSSGRYIVDAKSIMGIFSLDLSKPIRVEIQVDDCGSFCDEIKRFIV
jgi:phosphocarrier protein HPr